MNAIFEPLYIGKLRLKNRIIRSATMEGAGGECGISSELSEMYRKLATGGTAAIITGMVAIDESSSVTQSMIKTYGDSFVSDYSVVCDAAHQNGCRLIVQLAHCGAKAAQTDAGTPPLAPSAYEKTGAVEMSADELARLPGSFAEAALRCKTAGADGVEIHAAHGYLLSQFLSPVFNRRTDGYGGSLENRARIVLEVYDAVRRSVGPDFPVLIKINGEDRIDGGMTLAESRWVCTELAKRGIDAIEVSGGISVSRESAATPTQSTELDGIFKRQALEIAAAVSVPVISVGGYRAPERMAQALGEGIAAISICRPLISEPDLISRWERDESVSPRCISCNRCFGGGFVGCRVFEGDK